MAALVALIVVSLLSSGTVVVGHADPASPGCVGSDKVAADKMNPLKIVRIGAWRIEFR